MTNILIAGLIIWAIAFLSLLHPFDSDSGGSDVGNKYKDVYFAGWKDTNTWSSNHCFNKEGKYICTTATCNRDSETQPLKCHTAESMFMDSPPTINENGEMVLYIGDNKMVLISGGKITADGEETTLIWSYSSITPPKDDDESFGNKECEWVENQNATFLKERGDGSEGVVPAVGGPFGYIKCKRNKKDWYCTNYCDCKDDYSDCGGPASGWLDHKPPSGGAYLKDKWGAGWGGMSWDPRGGGGGVLGRGWARWVKKDWVGQYGTTDKWECANAPICACTAPSGCHGPGTGWVKLAPPR